MKNQKYSYLFLACFYGLSTNIYTMDQELVDNIKVINASKYLAAIEFTSLQHNIKSSSENIQPKTEAVLNVYKPQGHNDNAQLYDLLTLSCHDQANLNNKNPLLKYKNMSCRADYLKEKIIHIYDKQLSISTPANEHGASKSIILYFPKYNGTGNCHVMDEQELTDRERNAKNSFAICEQKLNNLLSQIPKR